MTALGKILAIFVLLLALVWLGLGMTAHVARTNWKTAAETNRKAAVDMQAALTSVRDEMDKQKKASDAQLANLQNQIKTQGTQIVALETTNQNNNTAIQVLQARATSQAAANALAEANLKQAILQNDILTDATTKLAKEKDDALVAQKNAENRELKTQLEADGIKKQNERFQNQVIALNDQIRDIRTGGNRPGASRVVPVPEGLRATVEKVDGDFVTISLGADALIREGAVLDVVRYGDQATYLGTLTVSHVSPKEASGQFASKDGPTAKGAALPRAGDTVIKIPTPGSR